MILEVLLNQVLLVIYSSKDITQQFSLHTATVQHDIDPVFHLGILFHEVPVLLVDVTIFLTQLLVFFE